MAEEAAEQMAAEQAHRQQQAALAAKLATKKAALVPKLVIADVSDVALATAQGRLRVLQVMLREPLALFAPASLLMAASTATHRLEGSESYYVKTYVEFWIDSRCIRWLSSGDTFFYTIHDEALAKLAAEIMAANIKTLQEKIAALPKAKAQSFQAVLPVLAEGTATTRRHTTAYMVQVLVVHQMEAKVINDYLDFSKLQIALRALMGRTPRMIEVDAVATALVKAGLIVDRTQDSVPRPRHYRLANPGAFNLGQKLLGKVLAAKGDWALAAYFEGSDLEAWVRGLLK